MNDSQPYWKYKTLEEMSHAEWEAVCDGCGKCCVHKLQDEDSGEIFFTNVACELLDRDTCRCRDYGARMIKVPDCVVLTPRQAHELSWLPLNCAYRLLSEGQELPAWHPLVSGNPDGARISGNSAHGRLVAEVSVVDIEDHVIEDEW